MENIQLNIGTCPTYPDIFIRDMVSHCTTLGCNCHTAAFTAIHCRYPVGNSTLYKTGCAAAVRKHTVVVGSRVFCWLATLTGLDLIMLIACR